MCCRCTLVKFLDEILAWIGEIENDVSDLPDLFESYNAAPTNILPVVASHDKHMSLELMTWGLVPSWSKSPDDGYKFFNARIESVHQKKSFRHLTKRKRGILICDGYFEWQHDGKQKYPFFIHKPNREIMPSRLPLG